MFHKLLPSHTCQLSWRDVSCLGCCSVARRLSNWSEIHVLALKYGLPLWAICGIISHQRSPTVFPRSRCYPRERYGMPTTVLENRYYFLILRWLQCIRWCPLHRFVLGYFAILHGFVNPRSYHIVDCRCSLFCTSWQASMNNLHPCSTEDCDGSVVWRLRGGGYVPFADDST
jgi:hypothetical protein